MVYCKQTFGRLGYIRDCRLAADDKDTQSALRSPMHYQSAVVD